MNIFEKNMLGLQRTDPLLASRVTSGVEDAKVSLQPIEGKAPTLIVHTDSRSYALHHPNDPLGHCQEFIQSIEAIKRSRNIAMLGFGLGYPALMLKQRSPNLQHFFVLEPSLSVFRMAMNTVDLTPLIEAGNAHIVVGNDPAAVYEALSSFLMSIMANPLTMLEIQSITAAFPTWAESVKRQIKEVMHFGQCGLMTKFKDGPLTLQNLFRNMNALAVTPGIDRFGKSLNGIPAIVVAAGPSLKKNIDELKRAEKEFLIIACDTAFEVLRKHQITPHIVVTVDPTELNIKHFPSEHYGPETILLFDPEARPEIVRRFPRRLTYMSNKHPFFAWLDRQLGGKGLIPKGGMVSQAGIFAAHYLGCSPIVLVGQDLALDPETGLTHSRETALCRTAHYLDGNPNQVDIPLFSPEKPFSREPLFWVEGIDGKPVPTVQNLITYLRMLETDIRKYSLRIIDATEGGAKIAGTTVMNLTDVIDAERKESVNVLGIIDQVMTSEMDREAQTSKKIFEIFINLIDEREAIALEGLKQLEDSNSYPISRIVDLLGIYQTRIFSDPIAEYLIEYAAPKELFDFLKLGPVNQTEEEERVTIYTRFHALLESVKIAKQRLFDS